MSKSITITSTDDAETYVNAIQIAADAGAAAIVTEISNGSGLDLFRKLKFEKLGFDPLDSTRGLNVVEQVNQTFTYLASFMAARLLFEWHPSMTSLTLNLGTASGSDLESSDCGGIAAEVFAATSPSNNDKLRKDVRKVDASHASHKYVFFDCPGIAMGEYGQSYSPEVVVWSLNA